MSSKFTIFNLLHSQLCNCCLDYVWRQSFSDRRKHCCLCHTVGMQSAEVSCWHLSLRSVATCLSTIWHIQMFNSSLREFAQFLAQSLEKRRKCVSVEEQHVRLQKQNYESVVSAAARSYKQNFSDSKVHWSSFRTLPERKQTVGFFCQKLNYILIAEGVSRRKSK